MTGAKYKVTDSRGEILECVGSETQQKTALPNSRIPNQEQLEQVVELRLTRGTFHGRNPNPGNQTKGTATAQ